MSHLALTIKDGNGITLETEDGEYLGHIAIHRGAGSLTKVAIDLPDNIRIVRDELIELDKEAVR